MGRHKPQEYRLRRLQKVWDERRFTEDKKQPNGYILVIFWEDHEVMVKFHDGKTESYPFEAFEGCWSESFGGCWLLENRELSNAKGLSFETDGA